MRYFKLFVIISALSILLASCAPTEREPETVVTETHRGTQGIFFNFLPNHPPAVIYTAGQQDTGHNIVLEVQNLGSETTGVYFYLSGFDPNIIRVGNPVHVIGSLEGKSPVNPEGGYTQIQFPTYGTLDVSMPPDIDVYPATLQATACYDYSTKASLPVCVDPDPYSAVVQRACTPHGATVGGGQGAPVAITSVQQESLRGRAIFKIRISNVGGGQVMENGYSPMCTEVTYDKFDKIHYAPFKLGGAAGQCLPASPVRLVNGQALITCVFNVPGNLAYTTTLDANLEYGYMNSKRKSIQIKKIS